MILEAALGDAYGAGFEFAAPEFILLHNTIERYETHPLYPEIIRRYTDDTQMSIAIAELLVEGAPWTPLNIASRFVEVFKRDPRRGYATRFYDLLLEVSSGEELLHRIRPDSIRNGAAMRAYPLGVLPGINDILQKTEIHARITHNTPEGVNSAQAIALMAHYTLYDLGPLSQLPDFLAAHLGIKWSNQWTGEVGINGVQTVEAILTILTGSPPDMRTVLLRSVAFGGDTDTVASLTLAILSSSREVAQNLPAFLHDELENGTYGRDYIKTLDARLLQLKA